MSRTGEEVAERLGNTPAISRKCYIHPDVLQAHQDRAVYDRWARATRRPKASAGLRADEAALLAFLRGRAQSGR